MLKFYIALWLICFVINIINSRYITKCKSELEVYYHALMPAVLVVLNIAFINVIDLIVKSNISNLMAINIIIAIVLAITFFVANGFVIVSKAINEKKDKEVTKGLLFIFFMPIIAFISIPIELFIYMALKYKKVNGSVKVMEEEIFDDMIFADNYEEYLK